MCLPSTLSAGEIFRRASSSIPPSGGNFPGHRAICKIVSDLSSMEAPVKIVLAGVVALALNGSAHAQSTSSTLTINSVACCSTWYCTNSTGPCGGPIAVTSLSCDSNEKTPAESVDCKITYWKDELAKLTKARDELNDKIAKAQERMQAFGDVKRGQH